MLLLIGSSLYAYIVNWPSDTDTRPPIDSILTLMTVWSIRRKKFGLFFGFVFHKG